MESMARFKLSYSNVYGLSFSLLFFILQCSSQIPNLNEFKPSGALEEVKKETEPFSETQAAAPDNPLLVNINERLQSLGYEGLGLQFETDETLLLLGRIFDSPMSQNRQIKLLYTGLAMSYDPKHRSLTIGGGKDLKVILDFIDKNIPKRLLNEKIENIPPVWMVPSTPSATQPIEVSSSTILEASSSTLSQNSTSTTIPSNSVTTSTIPLAESTALINSSATVKKGRKAVVTLKKKTAFKKKIGIGSIGLNASKTAKNRKVRIPPTVIPTMITAPSSTVTPPSSTVTVPSSTVTVPSSTVTVPSSTVTIPSSTVTVPSSTVTVPSSTVTVPSSTITVPNQELPASSSNKGSKGEDNSNSEGEVDSKVNSPEKEKAPETQLQAPLIDEI